MTATRQPPRPMRPPASASRRCSRRRRRRRRPARSASAAEELVRLVVDLYGAGLERLLEIVYDAAGSTTELLGRLAADDLVASLLLVHGLHPDDVGDRVERALDDVRPYLGSHGGGRRAARRDRRRASCGCGCWAAATAAPSRRSTLPPRSNGGRGAPRRRCRGRRSSRPRRTPGARPLADARHPQPPGCPRCRRDRPAPLAGLRRFRGRRRAARPSSAASMCGEPVGDRARPRRRRRAAARCCAPAARCYLLFTCRGARRSGATARSPTATCRPGASADRGGVGRARRSRSASAFFFHNSDARPGRRRSTRARPAPPSRELAARRLGRGRWRPTRRSPTLAPDVEALLVRAHRTARGSTCFLVPIDALLRAGRPAPPHWRGLRRRPGGARGARRVLRRRSRGAAGRSADAVSDSASPCLDVGRRAVRGRADAARCGCASPSRPAMPVHAIALRCQIRIEPQRAPLRAAEAEPAARPVRRPPTAGRDTLQAVPVDARRARWCRGFTGDDRGRPAGAVHLRLRGRRRQVLPRARRRRRAARCCCSAARCSRAAPAASRSSRSPWHQRGRATGCRSRSGAR